jgi:hypothetical protein
MIAPMMPGRGGVGRGARATLTGSPPSYATADLINNASFESGWDNFQNGSGGSPTGVTRETDQAYSGVTSVKRTWVANPDPTDDIAASFWGDAGVAQDRIFHRMYFRLSSGWSITSFHKFVIFREAGFGTQFGGWQLNDGSGLAWSSFLETSSVFTSLISKASITADTWHSIEVDLKRNGDALPNAAFWYDGLQITQPDGTLSNGREWIGGRLYFGPTRLSSVKVQLIQHTGTLNGGNTGTGSLWLDRIAASTQRIGP